jgi:hypothetical protein
MNNESHIHKALSSLKRNGFTPVFATNKEKAKEKILELISPSAKVGIGDSATVRQIGVIEELEKRGTAVVNPFVRELTEDLRKTEMYQEAMRKSVGCDVFLTSANAVTMDGKLVDIDGNGNRIAGTIFGPRKVILAVGRNKIVSDVNEALDRVRDVIAPVHARYRKRGVPCVEAGKCVDCRSRERICNITAIIEGKPHMTDFTVVMIDEDLGLGWDVIWPKERQMRIELEYGKVVWEHITPWHPKRAS